MELIREKSVSFSGNRIITTVDNRPLLSFESTLRKELYSRLEECYNSGKTTFISGYAIGWDLICVEEVLALQQKYPDVRLIAAIPFEGQEERYSFADKQRYHKLLSKATEVLVISPRGGYSNKAYHMRNDFMIKCTSMVIAYHNGKARSGTASTLRKAMLAGVEVVNLFDMV